MTSMSVARTLRRSGPRDRARAPGSLSLERRPDLGVALARQLEAAKHRPGEHEHHGATRSVEPADRGDHDRGLRDGGGVAAAVSAAPTITGPVAAAPFIATVQNPMNAPARCEPVTSSSSSITSARSEVTLTAAGGRRCRR